MNRILVLGGSGFIGEPLVAALRAEGQQVTAPSRAELDVSADPEKLLEFVRNHDLLVLLTQPDVQGIKNLVSAIGLSQLHHVLYASTGLVYGSSTSPQSEQSPVVPRTAYARAKYEEEEALLHAGAPLTIVRLGNVYGGPKNRGIVQKALEAMYAQRSMEIGGEEQVRDFVHVDDVVRAILALLRLVPDNARVVNVMTGRGVSIGLMLTLLEGIVGKPLTRTKGPDAAEINFVGDVSVLRALVGFGPSIALEAGLQKTVEAYDRSIRK